jgi:FtsP/CotA-like multicopper oxidase with cupredoxin domain
VSRRDAIRRAGAALALAGAACLFGFTGTQVLEVGCAGPRIPVRSGEVVTLRYTQSMYGTPVEERLRVADGRLVLFEVAASDAALEYLRIESRGPGNAALALEGFSVPADSVGGHVLAAGGREVALATVPTQEGRVRVRLARASRFSVFVHHLKESLP